MTTEGHIEIILVKCDHEVCLNRRLDIVAGQVFKRQILVDAYAQPPESKESITDDAQLIERAGHAVALVKSDPSNLKITAREDITLANAILKARPPDKPAKALGAFEEAQW